MFEGSRLDFWGISQVRKIRCERQITLGTEASKVVGGLPFLDINNSPTRVILDTLVAGG